MTKRERVQAALAGEALDRAPVSFWRHFPDRDLNPQALAEAMLDFHRRYDLDLIKVMPNGVYCVEDWGCETAYRGGSNGARTCIRHAVRRLADWDRLEHLEPAAGALGRELACLRAICAARMDDAPILQTVFSPFTVARKLAGPELVAETMARDPRRLHTAVGVITETVRAYALACLEAGADGLFYASQAATPEVLSPENHQAFAEPYDRRVLEALGGRKGLILFHLHGNQPYLATLASRYPVHALSWHDRRTSPSLGEASRQVRQALVGGLDERGLLVTGGPEEVRAQARDAIRQCGGRRLLLGPGCVLDLRVPDANLAAVREAAESLRDP
jgi:uroporphyrinogen decarboxylase